MIIKSLSRKTKSYKNLLNYLFQDTSNNLVLKKNIQGNSILKWVHEFKNNENNRLHQRSNNIRLFHEIVSLSQYDLKNVTNAKMKDIGKKYLQLRGDNIMAIGTTHMDKKHIHLHFCISSIELYTGRSLRLSKQRFKEIKQDLQSYQIQKYPELTHSVVDHGKTTNKKNLSEQEYHALKKNNQTTLKVKYRQQLNKILSQSNSEQDFYTHLFKSGFKTYQRNGITTGIVKDNKKYRFKTIGLDLKPLTIATEFKTLRNTSQNKDYNKDIYHDR